MSRLSAALSIALIGFGALSLRVFFSGLKEYRLGRASLEARDVEEAIVRFRRAASWYLPGNPIVSKSLDELEAIGKASQTNGNPATSRKAWEGIRAAILGSRGLYTPHAAKLAVANEKIAELLVALEGTREGETPAEQLAYHQQLLAADPSPHVGWTLLALAGFAVWVGGSLMFVFRGIRPNDALHIRPAFLSLLLVAMGFGLFMVGLAYA